MDWATHGNIPGVGHAGIRDGSYERKRIIGNDKFQVG